MSTQYDVVVVGGGIHGVGVAQAAACNGWSVLLLEKYALANGSSSRSSKLIHGGLRYLEHNEYGLVRESLRERDILLKIAPDLVELAPFHIPVYPATSRRPWLLRAGLALYAVLGGLDRAARFSSLPRRAWAQLDGLDVGGLQAVFRYYDAQTNDAELTRAVMQSAIEYGAELACPAALQAARVTADGCEIDYVAGDTVQHCTAGVLVNAAGAWAGTVDACIDPRPTGVPVDLVQGTHLVLPEPVGQGCYYVEAPQDRRAVFLMPRGEHSLLGTTEHSYHGDPQQVQPLDEEISYLQQVLLHYFPRRSTEVVEAFAGLRVLPTGGNASARSRETRLPVDDRNRPRRIAIYGGKLTGYRATAEKVIERIRPGLPSRKAVADTATALLRPVD